MAEPNDFSLAHSTDVNLEENSMSQYTIRSTNETYCTQISDNYDSPIKPKRGKIGVETLAPRKINTNINTHNKKFTLNMPKYIPHPNIPDSNIPIQTLNVSTQTDFNSTEISQNYTAVLQTFLIKQFSQLNTRFEKIENMIEAKTHIDLQIPLPVSSIEAMDDLEMKLTDENFKHKFRNYVKKIHGKDQDYARIIKHLFSDELLFQYNWNGEKGKRGLKWLSMFSEVLFDAIGEDSLAVYENKIRIIIKRTHQRIIKRNSRENQ